MITTGSEKIITTPLSQTTRLTEEIIMEQVSFSGSDQTMPVLGMGTSSWPPADPATAKAAILDAIRVGYRHFDTAFAYGSEKPLGEAIAEALHLGLVKSRDELFITTKLWSSFAAKKEMIVPAMKMSLRYATN